MADNSEYLENHLLKLGGLEREIEEDIKRLRMKAREAVRAGRLEEAEAACNELDALRPILDPLQSEIMDIERILYGMRRKNR